MISVAPIQHALLVIMLLGAGLLAGCGDGRSPSERVRAFCEGIRVGEPFEEVEARYSSHNLHSMSFAPAPEVRLKGIIAETSVNRVSGILVEDSASGKVGPRPVCAIYHNNWFLGGDGKVILAEFKAAWHGRD